ncbi:hypothetical protein GCM10009868_23530 [Terrabacter aerolatus]|uniref:Anti-sigma factor n=1 Tax=Terrabacter aerolatus TaxID=422442 RepID=A0A512D1W0_9MICO|nr:hypothetical protein [Terrabacter aerolatus]GEO30455.1 hypothetical protein TAE01_22650 [Terrabacter aerolatus]
MTPHLKGYVRAYVDRALPPAMLHLYDKHLVCCTVCRAAADQERRIVAALRSDTGVPMSLRTSLMGLGAAPSGEPQPAPAPVRDTRAPRIPLPPPGLRMPSAPSYDPVPTVRPTAPALHRSPMRAAVVASIAAGASVAAAWGLAIAPVPGSRVPSVRGPVASFGDSSVTAVNFGGSVLPGDRVAPVTRDSRSTRDLGSDNVPYWVVTTPASTRALGTVNGVVAPARVINVRSAQSGP